MPLESSTSRQFFFWIKFDRDREPKMFVAKSWEDFKYLLDREVLFHNEPPEWIIRDYGKS